MNKTIFKRLLAYIIDIVIVTIIVSVISLIPKVGSSTKSYQEYTDKINNIYENYQNKEITDEEYNNSLIDLTYKMDKESITYTITSFTCLTLYFVVFQYLNKGQTIGKKLLKIKIEPNDNNKLTIFSYLIRSLIINNLFATFINIICVFLLSKNIYYTVSNGISNIGSIMLYASIMCAILRPDGRTLHDVLSKSKVIDINAKEKEQEEKKQKEEKNNKIIEATYEEN